MFPVHIKIDKAKGCDLGSVGFAVSVASHLEVTKPVFSSLAENLYCRQSCISKCLDSFLSEVGML